MKSCKKIIVMILSLMLVFTLTPAAAFADVDPEDIVTFEMQGDEWLTWTIDKAARVTVDLNEDTEFEIEDAMNGNFYLGGKIDELIAQNQLRKTGKYRVRATAYNEAGETAGHAELVSEYQSGAEPTYSGDLNVTVDNSTGELRWDEFDGANDYRIYISESWDWPLCISTFYNYPESVNLEEKSGGRSYIDVCNASDTYHVSVAAFDDTGHIIVAGEDEYTPGAGSDEPASMELSIENGILSGSCSGAEKYNITVFCDGEDRETWFDNDSTLDFDINGMIANLFQHGRISPDVTSHHILVDAISGGSIIASGEMDYEFAEPEIAEITGLSYDSSTGMLSWDPVEGCDSYYIGIQNCESYDYPLTEIDINDLIDRATAGGEIVTPEDNKYSVTIRAYNASYAIIAEGTCEFLYGAGQGEDENTVTGLSLRTNGVLSWDPYNGAAGYMVYVNGEAGVGIGNTLSYNVLDFMDEVIGINNLDIPEDNKYTITVFALDDNYNEIAEGSLVIEYDYETGAGTFRFDYSDTDFIVTAKGDAADRIVVDINHEVEKEIPAEAGRMDLDGIIDEEAQAGRLRKMSTYEIHLYAYDGDVLVDEAAGFRNHYPEVESPEKGNVRVITEHISGNMTWLEYEGAAKYKIFISALGTGPAAEYTEVPEQVSLYELLEEEINNEEDPPMFFNTEIAAYDENGVIIADGRGYYYPGESMISAEYLPANPLEVNLMKDMRNGDYYGDASMEPGEGDTVTFTFRDGTVKTYTYDSQAGEFRAEGEEPISGSDVSLDYWSMSPFWAEDGDMNYYYVIFRNFTPYVPCRCEAAVSGSPVASLEYEPVPRLLKDENDTPYGYNYTGDKVIVHYKDPERDDDIFTFSKDTGTFVSQSGETVWSGSGYDYFNTTRDTENHRLTVTYMGVTAVNESAVMIADSISLDQSEPKVLVKGRNSSYDEDLGYDVYSIPRYDRFNTDDILTVTYVNSGGESIDVEYRSNGDDFRLTEGDLYFTDTPDDYYVGTYFSFDMPDQTAAPFESGQILSMNISYQEKGSNYEYQKLTTTGEPYRIKIKEPVTSLNFSSEHPYQPEIKVGDTLTFHMIWEPENLTPEITWTSGNTAVATVDGNGTVTAVAPGTAKITASADGISVSKTVKVFETQALSAGTLTADPKAYSGSPIESVNIKYNETSIVSGKHYSVVSFANNTDMGKGTVTIEGIYPYFTGTAEVEFDIKGDISGSFCTTDPPSYTAQTVAYTGEPVKPVINSVSFRLKDGTVLTLEEGKDYHMECDEKINPGTYYSACRLIGDGSYMGTKYVSFRIVELKNINDLGVSIETADYTYDGSAKEPLVTVTDGETLLAQGRDYTVTYEDNVNAGTAKAIVKGTGNYTGTKELNFRISPLTVTLPAAKTGLVYNGKAQNGVAAGTYYTITGNSKTNAGTYTATLTLKDADNYAWKDNGTSEPRKITWKIAKASQTITVNATTFSVAVGKTKTVTGSAKGTISFVSKDATIASVGSSTGVVTGKKVGTVTVTVKAAATTNYNAATKAVTIKVLPAATTSVTCTNLAKGIKVTWSKVTGATGYYVYRNDTQIKKITSGATVTLTDTAAATNGKKYVYKVVAFAGTGKSTLSKSKTIYLVKQPAISSITNSAAGKMTVKWAKNSTATGYEIQYSTSSTFASGNKKVTVTEASTVSKVIGSLTKGKTYYVRIRTYKTVSGTKYYSAWSAKKSLKIVK